MIEQLSSEFKTAGLKINFSKTKILTSENINFVNLYNEIVETVQSFIYLGHNIMLKYKNQEAEKNQTKIGVTYSICSKTFLEK